MKNWLDEINVIITGASSGIGRELARKLIEKHNAYVIGVGRSENKMLEFKESLGVFSGRFEYFLFDVSSEEEWKIFAKTISNRKIDMIINCAGILHPFASFDRLIQIENEATKNNLVKNESNDEKVIIQYNNEHNDNNQNLKYNCECVENLIKTNFMSCLYSCHYLSPIVERSERSSIINVASSAGLCALPGISVYSASKAALKNFTESLSLERNYYVGLVCPGFTKTDIFRSQKRSFDSKLINFISTDLDKMVNKIYKGIKRKKKRMVLGVDAKFMDFTYRYFPNLGLKFIRKILKLARIELFKDVF